MLAAFREAKLVSDTVGLIAYESKIPNLENFSELLNITIRQFTYQKFSDIEECLNLLKNEGINVVIGGSFLQEAISKKEFEGIKGIFIYSSDGVTRALDTAVQVAFSKQVEARKAEELRAILAFSYEGIIAVDRDGLITVINSSAEKIIGAAENKVIGQSVAKIFPNAKLTKVIQTNKPELNQIETVGKNKIVINRIPISVNSEVMGAVATFQNIGIIQEVEEKIRKSLYEKGFAAKTSIKDIIGNSEPIQKAKREAFLYAKNASSVLITGESGTGKELFAQSIHNASPRFRHPFVTINCAAIPDNLLESELFGYEEGAFTGAKKGGKPGLFELAHEGTVFLDEIGELSMSLQSRLLRVLEQREVLRIGGDHIRSVNIQVISATNKDLWEMTEKGYFRKDLYYRLNVLELRLPTLRARKSDIPLLVERFLTELCHDLTAKEIEKISRNAVFRNYDWPGNIRELRNMIERFAALYKEEDHEALLLSLFERLMLKGVGSNEQAEIIRVLKSVKGNKTEAAKKLGISRTTIWRKLRGYKETI